MIVKAPISKTSIYYNTKNIKFINEYKLNFENKLSYKNWKNSK